MKTKFLLPVMAMIFAIGISFASVKGNSTTATGFIQTAQGWEQVDVNCPEGSNSCEMYFSSNPQEIYPVYDAPGGNILKTSNLDPVELRD